MNTTGKMHGITERRGGAAWRGLLLAVAVALGGMARAAGGGAAEVAEAAGRVMVRGAGEAGYRGRAGAGMAVAAGEAVLTGPGAKVELRRGERARWRVGERAVWVAGADGGGELRAGTALAAIPEGERWVVDAADARVTLDTGVWLLTAVDNEGLKIVALDGGVVTTATADDGEARLGLAAGELIFAQPGGRGFGPIVTIFLDELLATSRLVTRFAEPLPQMERLRQQGAAQRERLRLVTNAHVGGARDAEGFQLRVPRVPAQAGGAGATGERREPAPPPSDS